MELCYKHGVLRRHSASVLKRLREEGVIELDFQWPTLDHLEAPRAIRYL